MNTKKNGLQLQNVFEYLRL